MRIALVAPDCNRRDGQARYVSEIATWLARRGHESHVFSVGFEETDPALVRHHQVPAPRRAARRRFFAFLVAASRALRRERFDIVHALGASCLRPDVITVQFVQAAWDEILADPARRSIAGGPIDALARRAITAVERRVSTSPRVARVIVVSRRVADDVGRFYGRTTGVPVFPQGVDLDRFRPLAAAERAATRAALGVAPETFLAVFLGEFQRKNLATAIAAVAGTRERRIVLLAAGGSDSAPYRALARRLGVEDRVRFAPRTPTPERLMAAADAFVFPTLYDPFGTVTLEAAACATPVVTSVRPGFAEWLDDGVSGMVLTDPLDARGFAERLDALARDPARAAVMGRAGAAIAQGFTWERVASDTERVYEEVLRARRESLTRALRGS